MNRRRWVVALVIGLVLGLLAGFALGWFSGTGTSRPKSPPVTPDQVITHIDFKAAVAWASEGKEWTVDPFPNDGINTTERKPLSRGDLASRSRRYTAKCSHPLTVDELNSFFNRVVNHLSDGLGKHAQPGGGGGIGMLPHNQFKVWVNHTDFHTGESPNLGTVGGTSGTMTVWMVSDGESSTLFLSLTEVTPGS